ncbi:FDLD family class I lanthipeptide [Crossiella cryophila]|uniref:Uncharacterized protein n=1 Tax=Crossiella cryophila TaxID=43355 RepID=A0A7W7FVQ9_9PSEU|nr:FDLD family class I lanthipeptide [Crossiella cryophila]MBB4679537.1 hypothetical protein [Crossiella cryophila]
MDAFDLDVRITTPAGADAAAGPLSIISRLTCSRTPICSKTTCQCSRTCTPLCTSGSVR